MPNVGLLLAVDALADDLYGGTVLLVVQRPGSFGYLLRPDSTTAFPTRIVGGVRCLWL